MAQINCIREMYFEKGMNYASIARATGHDVKTVKKYINMKDFTQPLPKPAKKRGSKLDKYKEEIDSWLEADKQARKKQRHTARRVFDRLAGIYGPEFNCSYRLVAAYVAERKKALYSQETQFFMPLEHIPGEAQVDFGEADFYEGNELCNGYYLNLSFPNSNGGYLQLFKGQNMQCLAEGLMNIFAHLGGVPTRLWFDNLSPAVKKILKNHGRELTDSFLRFKNHHGFIAAFCNPESGHEKGNVENKVGYHRRNLLVPIPRIDDLRAFNRQLLEKCDRDMQRPHYKKALLIQELFFEDRKALLPLPSVPYDESEIKKVRTNSYAKFTLNDGKHTYSTAPRYANSEVFVRLTAHDVIVLDESYREAIRHPRLYGKENKESMDWLPYLAQLARRPAALKYTGIYPMLPEPIQDFLDNCDYSSKKEALTVLAKLSEASGFNKATEAFLTALEHGVSDADSIIAMFSRLNCEVLDLDPLILPASVPDMPQVQANVAEYDRLFLSEGGIHES
jgi:transposase